MYSFFSDLLSGKTDGVIFECFGIWHWLYLLFFISLAVFAVFWLKDKSSEEKRKGTNLFINIVFILYVADFFLMPFVIQEIDIDKLPFHSCTSMCVMCFWSNHNRFLGKLRVHFAMLGMISNMMYMVYPSGVMSYEVHPFSYRAMQTLLFHGLMVIYGLLVIIFDGRDLKIKNCYKDAVIILCLSLWATLGNTFYSADVEGYSRHFNWFFLRQDPFYALPEAIAPYLSPVLNFVAFFGIELLIYLAYYLVCKKLTSKKENKIEIGVA